MQQTKIIHERFPYRYVESGILEINGMPDYRTLRRFLVTSKKTRMVYNSTGRDTPTSFLLL
jgi:hypothetical protein